MVFATLNVSALPMNRPAPNILVKDLNGQSFNLANFDIPDKLIISFAGTWCTPCLEEIAEFARLKEKQPNLEVILIFLDEDAAKIAAFQTEHKIPFLILHDAYKAAARRYEIAKDGEARIPATFVLDKKKKVVFQTNGFTAESLLQLKKVLGVKE